jgi:hypothetical protein
MCDIALRNGLAAHNGLLPSSLAASSHFPRKRDDIADNLLGLVTAQTGDPPREEVASANRAQANENESGDFLPAHLRALGPG